MCKDNLTSIQNNVLNDITRPIFNQILFYTVSRSTKTINNHIDKADHAFEKYLNILRKNVYILQI